MVKLESRPPDLTDKPAAPAGLRPRTAIAWAGLLIFLSAAYFENHAPLANVNSQFGLTCAIVERGTLSIDAYHDKPQYLTVDKAFFNGHYYCDKSPVNALLGVPVFACYRWLTRLPDRGLDVHRARYWTTLLTDGVAAAVLAMLLAAALMRRGAAPALAAMAAVLWVAATPLFGYTILFYSYLPAAALLLGGYLCVAPLLEDPAAAGRGACFRGGLLTGLAAWTMNTSALGALALTAVLVLGVAPRRAWGRLWPWALGGLLGIAGYFIYSHAVFGSFSSPYRYESNPLFKEQMAKGLMGATWPRPKVLWLLTFHKFQGLFRWFPFTLLGLAGAAWGLARRRAGRGPRLECAAALAMLGALLLYNSAYYMWWGGFAYAPRHLIPALPLLGLGLAPWLTLPRVRLRRMILAFGLFGALLNVTAVAVDPQPAPGQNVLETANDAAPQPGLTDEQLMAPETIKVWPSPFASNEIRFWIDGIVDKNLGFAFGLEGRATLLPLAGLWAAAWAWLAWRGRAKEKDQEQIEAWER